MKFADLHLHTVYSDGTYTPEELLKRAHHAGLSCVAVVDHDTVSGIGPTLEAAGETNIEVLPGIELTAEYAGLEIHLLGYLIDYQDKKLIAKLEELRENRIERIYKIIEKLKNMGVNLRPQAVFDLASLGTVGRLHVARAMVNEGLVSNVFEAFAKYIGDKCPAYVLGFRLLPPQAIKLIKDAGGVPVLAHPYVLNNDSLIAQFADYGLMGIEAYYPEHTRKRTSVYLRLAKKYKLLVTGGSDCHGSAKPEVKIGSVRIPYYLVKKLRVAQERMK